MQNAFTEVAKGPAKVHVVPASVERNAPMLVPARTVVPPTIIVLTGPPYGPLVCCLWESNRVGRNKLTAIATETMDFITLPLE